MYLDWTYIVLVLPAVLFAMWASAKVNRTFEKYKNSYNSRQITGAQAARWVLDRNGLTNVRIPCLHRSTAVPAGEEPQECQRLYGHQASVERNKGR